jgi:hypothetical protein
MFSVLSDLISLWGRSDQIPDSAIYCYRCLRNQRLEHQCEVCQKYICKYCIDYGTNEWKMYMISVCKECRAGTKLGKENKLPRIQCSKCDTSDSIKYYQNADKEILCTWCEFQHRINEYRNSQQEGTSN